MFTLIPFYLNRQKLDHLSNFSKNRIQNPDSYLKLLIITKHQAKKKKL